jgi:type IV secretory pathway VirJ component
VNAAPDAAPDAAPAAATRAIHGVVLGLAGLSLLVGTITLAAWTAVWLRDPVPDNAAPHRPRSLDAPLIEVDARARVGGASGAEFGPERAPFVILYTGDNGWQDGDKAFARYLSGAGMPVLAIDSLRYFSRSPGRARASRDLAQAIEAYARAWDRPQVILAGYSFGADALLQLLDGLPPATRARVRGVALIAPGPRSDLTLHPFTLFDLDKPTAAAMAPLLASLEGLPATCISASDDAGAMCPHLPATVIAPRTASGGHVFKGDRATVARLIAETGGPARP